MTGTETNGIFLQRQLDSRIEGQLSVRVGESIPQWIFIYVVTQGVPILCAGTLSFVAESNILDFEVNLLDNSACSRHYAATSENITSAMICASGKSESGITDTCQGAVLREIDTKTVEWFLIRRGTWGGSVHISKFPNFCDSAIYM